MDKLATLTDGTKIYNYFSDGESTFRVDECDGEREWYPCWEDDILTWDLADMDILYLKKDMGFLWYYLNEKDIHEIWDIRFEDGDAKYSSKDIVQKITSYLEHRA